MERGQQLRARVWLCNSAESHNATDGAATGRGCDRRSSVVVSRQRVTATHSPRRHRAPWRVGGQRPSLSIQYTASRHSVSPTAVSWTMLAGAGMPRWQSHMTGLHAAKALPHRIQLTSLLAYSSWKLLVMFSSPHHLVSPRAIFCRYWHTWNDYTTTKLI